MTVIATLYRVAVSDGDGLWDAAWYSKQDEAEAALNAMIEEREQIEADDPDAESAGSVEPFEIASVEDVLRVLNRATDDGRAMAEAQEYRDA